MSTAEARGSPERVFSGKLEIHLMPSVRSGPPSEAGSAMIRALGRSGNRRKYEGGFTVSPVPCSRYTASISSAISNWWPVTIRWTCSPDITANRGAAAVIR